MSSVCAIMGLVSRHCICCVAGPPKCVAFLEAFVIKRAAGLPASERIFCVEPFIQGAAICKAVGRETSNEDFLP